jgi:hypothetical protein
MKARELSQEECVVLLSKCRYGRLGLSMNDVPYVIPISFVYLKDKIYLHSRGEGKKIEFAIKNPNVCFQIDIIDKDCWSSVVAYGTVKLSSSSESKLRMFDAFIRKGMGGHGGKHFQREELEKMDMTIWEIQIREMTGREGIW